MARRKTYYEILGVSENASEAEIRKGYRQAIKRNHPDINPDSKKAERRTRELNTAMEVLMNAETRRLYDEKLQRRKDRKAKRKEEKRQQRDWNANQYESATPYAEPVYDDIPLQPETPRQTYSDRWRPPKPMRTSINETRRLLISGIAIAMVVIGMSIIAWFGYSNWIKPNLSTAGRDPNGSATKKLVDPKPEVPADSNLLDHDLRIPDEGPPPIPRPIEPQNVRPTNPFENQPPVEVIDEEPETPTDLAPEAPVNTDPQPPVEVKKNPPPVPINFAARPGRNAVRFAVPTDDQLESERDWLLDRYSYEFERISDLSGERLITHLRNMAGRFLRAARIERDEVRKYALLKAAFDSALNSGSPDTLIEVIEFSGHNFVIDEVGEYNYAVSLWFDQIQANYKGRSRVERAKLLLQLSVPVTVAFVKQGRPSKAIELLQTAIEKGGDDIENPELTKQLVSIQTRLIDEAAEDLDFDAADAQSTGLNADWWEILGEHWCYEFRNWSEGLRFLRRSNNLKLRQLAELETRSKTAEDKMQLGELWWKLADENQQGRRGRLWRANYWYKQALAEFGGVLNKPILERVKMIDEELQPPLCIPPFNPVVAEERQERWAYYLDKDVDARNSLGMEFRLIPPGEFDFGRGRDSIRVKIHNAFYMGVHEVTQAEYNEVMNTTAGWFSERGGGRTMIGSAETDDWPVEYITRGEAMEFCRKLSDLKSEKNQRRVYRLPTEFEWEFACRAGSAEMYSFGDEGSMLGRYAWYSANSLKMVHKVGQKPANPFGLHDMHGNVCEICWNLNKGDPNIDLLPRVVGKFHWRGGSFNSIPSRCHSGFREPIDANKRSADLGFRVILVAEPYAEVRDSLLKKRDDD